jgi:hypothetical protein
MKRNAVVCLLLLAAYACGRSPLEGVTPKTIVPASGAGGMAGHTGGATGAVATGGAVGSGGSGGQAGASGAGDCPPCIAETVATCIPAGSCRGRGGNAPHASFSNTCYENGVMVQFFADPNVRDVIVSRDGRPCYTIHSATDSTPNRVTVTAGTNQLAQGTVEDGQTIIDCGGTGYVLRDTCGKTGSVVDCASGNCP